MAVVTDLTTAEEILRNLMLLPPKSMPPTGQWSTLAVGVLTGHGFDAERLTLLSQSPHGMTGELTEIG